MTGIEGTWHKSSYSNSTGECVEAANMGDPGMAMRDTQFRALGHLTFDSAEWASFLEDIKSGSL